MSGQEETRTFHTCNGKYDLNSYYFSQLNFCIHTYFAV